MISIMPEDVVLNDRNLDIAIRRSKTTGPGKRVEVLQAVISKDSFLVAPGWVEIGFVEFHLLAGHLYRDYLLPLPTRPWMVSCRSL